MAPIGALVVAIMAASTFAGRAAELPSQPKKPKPPEAAQAMKKCNVAGITGVLAANGVCVKLGGYISTGVSVGQIK